jgi:hypothetical protein
LGNLFLQGIQWPNQTYKYSNKSGVGETIQVLASIEVGDVEVHFFQNLNMLISL